MLWEAADRICGKRLKALLPSLVEAMERHKHLQLEEGVRALVLAMSAATIDRQLRSVREKAFGGRKKSGAGMSRVRKMVPVRTFADWGEVGPGYLEVDMVVHCGARAEGSFVHTLVLTDVASGWTECVALPLREQALIVEAVTGLRRRLPGTVAFRNPRACTTEFHQTNGDSKTKPFAESAFMAKLQRVSIAYSFGANLVSSTLGAPARRDPDGNVSNLPRKREIEYELTGMSSWAANFQQRKHAFPSVTFLSEATRLGILIVARHVSTCLAQKRFDTQPPLA